MYFRRWSILVLEMCVACVGKQSKHRTRTIQIPIRYRSVQRIRSSVYHDEGLLRWWCY